MQGDGYGAPRHPDLAPLWLDDLMTGTRTWALSWGLSENIPIKANNDIVIIFPSGHFGSCTMQIKRRPQHSQLCEDVVLPQNIPFFDEYREFQTAF